MKLAALAVVPVRAWLGLLLTSVIAARAAGPPLDSSFTVQGWDSANGLPPNSITSLARTADGYLWLGTSGGLVRFDGVRFVTLATNTVPALGDNRISCLHADRNGTLWVGTEGGTLSRREAGVFTSVPVSEKRLTDWAQGGRRHPRWAGQSICQRIGHPSGVQIVARHVSGGRLPPLPPNDTPATVCHPSRDEAQRLICLRNEMPRDLLPAGMNRHGRICPREESPRA